jgi:hypothetical protein
MRPGEDMRGRSRVVLAGAIFSAPKFFRTLLSGFEFTRVMVCMGTQMPIPVGSKGRPWLTTPPAAQAAPDQPEARNAG